MGRRANSQPKSRRRKDSVAIKSRGSIAAQFGMYIRHLLAAAAIICLLPLAAASAPGSDAAAKLPLTTVIIDSAHGPVRFLAELAVDPVSQEKGLMFRTKLAPDSG